MKDSIKPFAWILSLVAIVAIAGFALVAPIASNAQAPGAAVNGASAPAAPVVLSQATRGVVFFTAAVNADGSTASCFACTATTHLGTGLYEVDFGQDVEAVNGWSRWTQADTLTAGTTLAFCDTADRAGNPNGIFINCQNAAGTAVDTAFFLFVAR